MWPPLLLSETKTVPSTRTTHEKKCINNTKKGISLHCVGVHFMMVAATQRQISTWKKLIKFDTYQILYTAWQ